MLSDSGLRWVIVILSCALLGEAAATDPALPEPEHRVALHLHTTIGGDPKSPAQFMREAKAAGLAAVFITDHDYQRWEYGAWPARGLIKQRIDLPSALKLGAARYLQALAQADRLDPDVRVIDGMEAAPFYYWSGSYWDGSFTLNDRDKHLLVFGLDASGYEQMPLIANGRSHVDQYHGHQYAKPYQELIDYVVQRGGLIFWAHPSIKEVGKVRSVRLSTLPYEEMLVATDHYTGFAVYPTGGRLWEAGNLWDRVLREYCEGRRGQPAWAIGELDDHGDQPITGVATVIWAPERTRPALLEALRHGHMYVTYGQPGHPKVQWYAVRDAAANQVAFSGEELRLTGPAMLECTIASQSPGSSLKVLIIKDGVIIHEESGPSPLAVRWTDTAAAPTGGYHASGQKSYYRLYAQNSEGMQLLTNPIFVIAP
ncbi:MAG: hypothetical protein HY597_05025 [Candidatus Omnitrophica bacterium]|nr:hypothetical protein [Candidatus Omnitrophota bacterium]